MAGRIGKFLQGAAEVAVPAAMESLRARFQQQRDAALNEYRTSERQDEQRFAANQNEKDRNFRTRIQDADFAHDTEENRLNREHENQKFFNELSERKRVNDAQIRESDASTSSRNLRNRDEADRRRLQDIMMSDNFTQADKDRAAEDLGILMGSDGDADWTIENVYTDEYDDAGNQKRQSVPFNRRSGTTGQLPNPQKQAKIRQIMQANPGKDETWAEAYLEYLENGGQ